MLTRVAMRVKHLKIKPHINSEIRSLLQVKANKVGKETLKWGHTDVG